MHRGGVEQCDEAVTSDAVRLHAAAHRNVQALGADSRDLRGVDGWRRRLTGDGDPQLLRGRRAVKASAHSGVGDALIEQTVLAGARTQVAGLVRVVVVVERDVADPDRRARRLGDDGRRPLDGAQLAA